MKSKFKFFRGHIGTLDIMDGVTYATASIYNPNTYWSPEESERIRNQRIQISNDLRQQPISNSNNEMERYFTERINQIEEQQLRLFQATTTITVNPTFWTKIKIFGTRIKLILTETWRAEPVGIIFVTLLSSVLVFIGIMKLFGA